MRAATFALAFVLLSTAVVATPGAAAFTCTVAPPPGADEVIQCAVDLADWAQEQAREVIPPNDLLDEIGG